MLPTLRPSRGTTPLPADNAEGACVGSMEHTGSDAADHCSRRIKPNLKKEVDQTAANCFDGIDSDECASMPAISRQLTPKLTFLDVTMVFKRSPPLLRKLASLYHAITFCQVSMRK